MLSISRDIPEMSVIEPYLHSSTLCGLICKLLSMIHAFDRRQKVLACSRMRAISNLCFILLFRYGTTIYISTLMEPNLTSWFHKPLPIRVIPFWCRLSSERTFKHSTLVPAGHQRRIQPPESTTASQCQQAELGPRVKVISSRDDDHVMIAPFSTHSSPFGIVIIGGRHQQPGLMHPKMGRFAATQHPTPRGWKCVPSPIESSLVVLPHGKVCGLRIKSDQNSPHPIHPQFISQPTLDLIIEREKQSFL